MAELPFDEQTAQALVAGGHLPQDVYNQYWGQPQAPAADPQSIQFDPTGTAPAPAALAMNPVTPAPAPQDQFNFDSTIGALGPDLHAPSPASLDPQSINTSAAAPVPAGLSAETEQKMSGQAAASPAPPPGIQFAEKPQGSPYMAPQSQSMDTMTKGYGMMEQGEREKAAAQAGSFDRQAKLYGESQKQLAQYQAEEQAMRQKQQATVDAALKKQQDMSDEIQKSAKIDPSRIFSQMGTGAKITAGISIALGALGGAMTGQGGNAAMDVINKAIDRDIDAQKMELESKKTKFASQGSVLSTMMSTFGDQRSALAATKAAYLDTVKMQAEQLAAQANSEQARAAAKAFIGNVEVEKAKTLLPFQQQHAFMSMVQSQSGGAGSGAPFIPPKDFADWGERTVPGLGLAKDKETAKKVTDYKAAYDGFENAITRLKTFAEDNRGSLTPSKIAYGHSLAAAAQNSYRTAESMGVFKESEAEWMKKLIGDDPTSFTNVYSYIPKLNALSDTKRGEAQSFYRAHGFKVPEFKPR